MCLFYGIGGELVMDKVDKDILNIIQSGFPVDVRPYAVIGQRVNITEEQAHSRVMGLKKEGVIRRIGATFDSRKLHFISTLCTLSAPEEKIDDIAAIISSFSEVTHNYQRNHKYNVWFTLIAESQKRIEEILAQITQKTGVNGIRNMPASERFKIKVDFHFNSDDGE